MFFAKRLPSAIKSVTTNKMRTAMIMFTLSLGTVLLVLTISLKEGVEEQISGFMDLFFHPNAGAVSYPDFQEQAGFRPVSYAGRLQDLRLLQSRIGDEAAVVGEIQEDATVSYGGRHLSLLITAAEPPLMEIKRWKIRQGSVLDGEDEASRNRVCVITTDVARNLFGSEPCIGEEVQIAGVPFRVKGVRSANESAAKRNYKIAHQILVPLSTGMARLWRYDGPVSLAFEAREAFPLQKVVNDIATLLRKEHNIAPPRPDDFEIGTIENALNNFRAGKSTFIKAGFGLSILALLIGAGITANTMLTSLDLRKSEFALKRALGASRANLSSEMVLESLMISIGGFILGGLMSCAFLVIWRWCASPMTVKRFPMSLGFSAFLVPACLEVAIGLSCAALAMRRFSRADVVRALRG